MNIIPWRRREGRFPAPLELDELFENFWNEGHDGFGTHLPEVFRQRPFTAVNVKETPKEFRITMDCPGLDEEDIEVETMGNRLLISGERKWEEETKDEHFRRVESQYGKFQRTVQLPDSAKLDGKEIKASYEKGVLTVAVPRSESVKTAKIPVKAGKK